MSRQKTKEEYEAAAMLLGMIYDEQINTFYTLSEGLGDQEEIDADTMEPLSAQEISQRYMEPKEDIASFDDFDSVDDLTEFAPSTRLP